MDRRAILFDLDDTLYRERRFILSGFAVVARAVEDTDGVPAADAYRVLVAALRLGRRATAFQELCDAYDLDRTRIANWVSLVRVHAPRLRAGRRTRTILAGLRTGWRLGLVTNGLPEVQRRKIDGLRLRPFFDHICLAGLPGHGGKPSPEPFFETCAALGVKPARAVHVGDNVETDVQGAQRAGLKTILLTLRSCSPFDGLRVTSSGVEGSAPPRASRGVTTWAEQAPERGADRVVQSLVDVPDAAEALIHDA